MARTSWRGWAESRGDAEKSAIRRIAVGGYKSLAAPEPYEIEIRDLTLLAGANSSGKSSAIQPLLLLKQTLEAPFDPGPLLLDGPHVRFTSQEQILPTDWIAPEAGRLLIGLEVGPGFSADRGTESIASVFRPSADGVVLESMVYEDFENARRVRLTADLSGEELRTSASPLHERVRQDLEERTGEPVRYRVWRRRSFLDMGLTKGDDRFFGSALDRSDHPERALARIIHVPGLRGNPERIYPTSAIGRVFPGTFQNYVASIVKHWQGDDKPRLKQLGEDLRHLGLTWKVSARQIDATRVELEVGRLLKAKRGGARDLVNIADVGFGVSQVLPVVVGLLAAEPGQLLYLEQPEIHLHPRAHQALAELLARAASRGVRVVAETHSPLLLLAVQSLVAEGSLPTERVILHWFQRDADGVTRIKPATLDERGAYGDWPEDFGEVELAAHDRYLDAVEGRMASSS